MIPTKQTKFGKKGNCFAACVASILEIPINVVPDLGEYEKSGYWIHKFNEWLSDKYKLVYIEVETPLEDLKEFFSQQPGGFYHTIIGKAPKSKTIFHSVVGREGELVFDPSPDNEGLVEPKKTLRTGMFVKTFLDF